MDIDVQVYNVNNDIDYDEVFFEEIAHSIIKKFGKISKSVEALAISIAFVSEREIRDINNSLRDKDEETDVISVGDYSDNLDISTTKEKNVFLGEVIMCYNYIEAVAVQNKVNSKCEILNVYIHGILHLLGFKHSEEMFDLQDNVLEKFCNKK